MPTVLISGANRGLGLEFARQYAAAGWRVIGGCREPEAATALNAITSVHAIRLDVDDFDRIGAAARALEGETIDLLINNAGVFGSTVGDQNQTLDQMDPARWLETLRINLIGQFLLTRACLPLMKPGGIIALMSSELGSVANNNFGELYGYRSSKAGLNMVGKSLAIDLRPRGITVVILHPGWAHTDMGGPNAPVDPVESIKGLRRVLAEVTPDSSGRFLAWDGREMPW